MTEIMLYSIAQCCVLLRTGFIVFDPEQIEVDDLVRAVRELRPGSIGLIRAWDVNAVRSNGRVL